MASGNEGLAGMADGDGDYQRLLHQKRFVGEIEQAIRQINRELIHARVPVIDKEKVVAMARVVGLLRARYLESAFRLSRNADDAVPDKPTSEELHLRRQMYEEARMAFDSLREAIEKGYVDVQGVGPESRPFQR